MKKILPLFLIMAIGVGALLLTGCQTKEVTSAKVYIQQDDWEKAIEQLEVAVKLYPNDLEAHKLLGQCYGRKAEYGKMVEQFDASLAIAPTFADDIKNERAYYWTTEFNAGVKLFNQEKIEEAVGKFSLCKTIDPTRAESYKNLVSSYMRLEQTDNATAAAEEWMEAKPEDVEAMLRLHDLYNSKNESEKAIEVSLKALKVEPDNVDVLTGLAITYDKMGEGEKARDTYLQAIEKNPDNVDLLFNLGRLYFMQGNYTDAIKYFDSVIAKDPEDYESNLNVGNAYLTMAEQFDKKVHEMEEEKGKELPDMRQQAKDYYRNAVPYLQKALDLKPDEGSVWNNIGVAYIRSDEVEKGKEAFKKAEELGE